MWRGFDNEKHVHDMGTQDIGQAIPIPYSWWYE